MTKETLDPILVRNENVRHGCNLEYFTIGWNSLEAVVAVGAGVFVPRHLSR